MFWRKFIKLGDTILFNSIETTSKKIEYKKEILKHRYLNYNSKFLPLVVAKTIQVIQGQIFCEEFLKKSLESGVKM